METSERLRGRVAPWSGLLSPAQLRNMNEKNRADLLSERMTKPYWIEAQKCGGTACLWMAT